MKFNQVMGIIYLVLFISLLAYKMNAFLEEQQEPLLIGLLFFVIILIILMLVRKIVFH